jgi:hypothetical protein
VAETFVDGQTVNGVARRHNIGRSMLFGWRKQYCETGFAAPASTPIGFSPVAIARSDASEPAMPPTPPVGVPLIELEFGRSWPKVPAGEACWNGQRRGGVRLRISGAVDPDLAAAVMKALPRR